MEEEKPLLFSPLLPLPMLPALLLLLLLPLPPPHGCLSTDRLRALGMLLVFLKPLPLLLFSTSECEEVAREPLRPKVSAEEPKPKPPPWKASWVLVKVGSVDTCVGASVVCM